MLKREWRITETEDEWLSLRSQDLTSTDVAALFGLSPYLTAFELWHRKRNGETVSIEDNKPMIWGRRMERTIAEGIAEDEGFKIESLHLHYCRIPDLRIGSSFDYAIIDMAGRYVGLLEIKNVGLTVYRKGWTDDTAPPHIELQLQHQLFVSGLSWGYIGALVGGNDDKLLRREADPAVAARIAEVCAEFWRSVEENDPPDPDFTRDSAYIIRSLRSQAGGPEVESEEAGRLAEEYKAAKALAAAAEADASAARAQLYELVGDADLVKGSWGKANLARTKDSPGKIITPEMVGQYVGAKKGHRNCLVTLKEEG